MYIQTQEERTFGEGISFKTLFTYLFSTRKQLKNCLEIFYVLFLGEINIIKYSFSPCV